MVFDSGAAAAARLSIGCHELADLEAARRRPNWTSAPVYFSLILCPDLQLNAVSYKGFAITPRTFQVRGSGRWTLDLLIGRQWGLRAFSGPRTYPTEESAITGCCEFGRRIIDGLVRNCAVDDLS
jgi:hypothetical protein